MTLILSENEKTDTRFENNSWKQAQQGIKALFWDDTEHSVQKFSDKIKAFSDKIKPVSDKIKAIFNPFQTKF